MAADSSNDHRNGVFLPKGAVHLIGPATFEQALKENNFFLTTVATVPVNLELEAWFAVIDANHTSDDKPVSLHDHLLRQPWFIRLEYVSRNKTIIITTKPNLQAAREWVDANLEPMIRKSIPPDIAQPPSDALHRRLDKQVYTATSRTYADILKQQFSLATNETTANNDNNRPPRKRQATVIDYDSDPESQSIPSVVASNNSNNHSIPSSSTSTPSTAPMTDYATELLSLKTEIQALCTMLTATVEQIKSEIVSIRTTPATAATSAMETEATPPQYSHQHHQKQPNEISSLIHDIKHDIANFVIETRALLQHQSSQTMSQHPLSSKT